MSEATYPTLARMHLELALTLIDNDPVMAALHGGLAKSALALHAGEIERAKSRRVATLEKVAIEKAPDA